MKALSSLFSSRLLESGTQFNSELLGVSNGVKQPIDLPEIEDIVDKGTQQQVRV